MKLPIKPALVVFFSLFGLLMFVDLYFIIVGGYEATVSATLYEFTQRFPIIGVIFGVLIGHLFFPNSYAARKEQQKEKE